MNCYNIDGQCCGKEEDDHAYREVPALWKAVSLPDIVYREEYSADQDQADQSFVGVPFDICQHALFGCGVFESLCDLFDVFSNEWQGAKDDAQETTDHCDRGCDPVSPDRHGPFMTS